MWFFWKRSAREQELDRELKSHLEAEAEEQRESGIPADEAIYAAQRAFGNQTLTKESVREAWGWTFLETFTQDLRFAFRTLRASPVFALVAILSLGLGIGANTAIFSFVNALLLQRLPVPEPDKLVRLAFYEKGELANNHFSYPFVTQLEKRAGVFEGVSASFPVRVNLITDNGSEPLAAAAVTGNYFHTLRVQPAVGRLLNDADVESANADPVCVLSYALWQGRFGGDPQIVGRKLMLNTHLYTVIGISQQGFHGPQLQSNIDLQIPLSRMGDFMGFFALKPGAWRSPTTSWLVPLARLKAGVSMAQAQARVDPIARAIRQELVGPGGRATPQHQKFGLRDGSQGANYTAPYAQPITILMGIVALVLLIACANLANLLLARSIARSKEFAVRLSLGASRLRVIRQLMVESLCIAACGGIAGLLLAFWLTHTLLLYLNAGRPAGRSIQVAIDPKIVAFSILLSLITAIIFGLAPAWQSAHTDTIPELKGNSARFRAHLTGVGLRRFLIVSQIALSLIILFSAGLMTRTLSRLKTIDLGFNPVRVFVVSIDPALSGYAHGQIPLVYQEIVSRLRRQPSVAAASFVLMSPLAGGLLSTTLEVPGHPTHASNPDLDTYMNAVSPDYFKTLNQTMLAGRDFNDSDQKTSHPVAIVNQLFAAEYFPGVNPIGRHFKTPDSDSVEIVGVVKNALYQELREKPAPVFYLPAFSSRQTDQSEYTLLIRSKPDAPAALPAIQQAIRSFNPKLAAYDIHQMQNQIDHGITSERILSFLSIVFSALATFLCCMGIYGLIAYAVSRRTNEIGIRFAIGAQKADVAKLFLRESGMLMLGGVLLGIPLALASARVLKSLLFGVEANDSFTLAVTVSIFLAAGVLATWLPVRKATRIEPLQALRYE